MTIKFEPHLTNSQDEEKAYRRGFDQGVAALASALGIPSGDFQQSVFKQRVKDFRSGHTAKADSLWRATPAESKELCGLVQLGKTP